MAIDRRQKNMSWAVRDEQGNFYTNSAQLAVLMDIRDELQRLNSLLHCYNATSMPVTLREIRAAVNKVARNTTKKRKPKPAK